MSVPSRSHEDWRRAFEPHHGFRGKSPIKWFAHGPTLPARSPPFAFSLPLLPPSRYSRWWPGTCPRGTTRSARPASPSMPAGRSPSAPSSAPAAPSSAPPTGPSAAGEKGPFPGEKKGGGQGRFRRRADSSGGRRERRRRGPGPVLILFFPLFLYSSFSPYLTHRGAGIRADVPSFAPLHPLWRRRCEGWSVEASAASLCPSQVMQAGLAVSNFSPMV